MGKIPEYQRSRFVSSHVGDPRLDTSGMKAAEGIGKGVLAVADLAAKEAAQKEQTRIDQEANNALLKYSLAYQKQAKALQVEYADNPSAYPEALTNLGTKMQEEFSGRIPDEKIKARFGQAANTVVRASLGSAINWSEAKQESNALVAAKDTMRLAALTTGESTSLEELGVNIQNTKETIAGITNLSAETKAEFITKNMPNVLESHFYNRVRTDPETLINDLESGAYNKTEYYTAEMKDKFIKAANTEIRRQKTQLKEDQTDNYAGLQTELLAGNLTFGMIDDFLMAEDPAKQITPGQGVQLKRSLVNKAETDAARIEKVEEDAITYNNLIYDVFDNEINRAKALESITKVFADGITTKEEGQFLSFVKNTLKTEKTARMSGGIKKGLTNISNAVERFWDKGEEKETKKAKAFRELLKGAAEGKDIGELTEVELRKFVQDKMTELKIDLSTVPKEGKRLIDEDGTSVWVYPDGRYKVEQQ